MPLTLTQARAVIGAAESRAREMGVTIVAAVLDAGVHLKAFTRMDGAPLASIDIAVRKARTAALFGVDSEAVWEYCRPGAPAPGLEFSNGGLAPFGGGVPLRAGDEIVGAIGVSGGSVTQDLEIAQTAAAALESDPAHQ